MFEHSIARLAKFMRSNNKNTYEKRVNHDRVVPRNRFQDIYCDMKSRYKNWVDKWGFEEQRHGKSKKKPKSTAEQSDLKATGNMTAEQSDSKATGNMTTDPQKHVFEEIAIASFLIGLWQEEYGSKDIAKNRLRFLDLGCGNGFLTYLLHNEGFIGHGIDISKRDIWNLYPEDVRLNVDVVFPKDLVLDVTTGQPVTDEVKSSGNVLDLWIIGNHADELTPWIPVIAARSNHYATKAYIDENQARCKYFILPCCFHDFSGSKNTFQLFDVDDESNIIQPHERMPSIAGGRYESYVQYITQISNISGFEVEREVSEWR